MHNNNENRFNYLGNFLLLVFFFFFIGNLSKSPKQLDYRSHQFEISSHIESSNFAVANGQDFFFHKNLIAVLELNPIHFMNTDCHLTYYNSLTNSRLVFLQKNEVLIRPKIFEQYLYYFRFSNSDNPPSLS